MSAGGCGAHTLFLCPSGTIGSALPPGGAPGAAPGAAPRRTKGNARIGAPGAGIGIAGGRGPAAGTREGLAHGTESVKGMASAPVKVSRTACLLNSGCLPLSYFADVSDGFHCA